MKDTLEYIVTAIVENTKDVSIAEEETEDSTNFIITVATTDMGKIIGKEGRMIRAIRNVMKIPAIKTGKRINITLAQ